jgi:hypothetical protein
MSDTQREYAANYRKPPEHTSFKKGQSGNPRGRTPKNLPALLAAALNEKVTVTENGKRRQITKREAVIAQLVNKSAAAELRATKMLIDMLRDVEKKAEPAPEKNPFAPTDQEVVQGLIARLRRNMCNGCPWAARRDHLDGSADRGDAETTGKISFAPEPPSPQPSPRERGEGGTRVAGG